MKIKYNKIQNENPYISQKCIYEFKIVSSILKKHYKSLARISMLFNSRERNHGFIKKEDEQSFLRLVQEIEDSNNKRCETSHKKAVEKYRKRKSVKCEHDDLGSLGYKHGERVQCPRCGQMTEVW
jgi:DNA-directed RNA polymerase subunit M/transcription elongation factor TFIIS